MSSITPSPFSRLASSLVSGLVSTVAQSFVGVKTFVNGLIASAAVTINSYLLVTGAPPGANLTDGQSAYLGSYNNNIGSAALWLAAVPSTTNYAVAVSTSGGLGTPVGTTLAGSPAIVMGRNGTGSSDVCTKVGTNQPDGSVHSSAKIWSARTGLGGTEVEQAYITKGGNFFANYLRVPSDGAGGVLLGAIGLEGNTAGGGLLLRYAGGVQKIVLNAATGLISQAGTDRSSTIGADTQNNPSGINTLASGATSVTITNSLVPNPATTKVRVMINWRADPGARHWVTQNNGSFTVNLSAAPGSNVSFDWEVCGLT